MSDSLLEQVKAVLIDVLRLNDQALQWRDDTPLLGAIPELDSLAVINVITSLEDHFKIRIHDDEVSSELFATLGNLTAFIQEKIGPSGR